MSNFNAKMHQIRFLASVRLSLRWSLALMLHVFDTLFCNVSQPQSDNSVALISRVEWRSLAVVVSHEADYVDSGMRHYSIALKQTTLDYIKEHCLYLDIGIRNGVLHMVNSTRHVKKNCRICNYFCGPLWVQDRIFDLVRSGPQLTSL